MRKKQIKKITIMAILMALSIVLKKFSIDTGVYRISLFDTPLFLAGMIGGPIWGCAVALCTDIMYNLLSSYAFSFLMMITTVMWGLIGGLFHYIYPKFFTLLVVILITSVITTFINSVQLALWYGAEVMLAGLALRVSNMLIKWPITTLLVYIIYQRVVKVLLKDLLSAKKAKNDEQILERKKRKLHFK